MSLDLNTLMTDSDAVENGVWVDYKGGSRLLVASMGSPRYKAEMARLAKLHRIELASDEQTPEMFKLVERLSCKAMSSTVLLGWQDIMVNGSPVDYSPATAEHFLLNSTMFRKDVEEAANIDEAYRLKLIEDVKKQQPGESSGEEN